MPPLSELIRHKTVLAALGVVGVILVGSVGYYVVESRPPALSFVPVEQGSIAEDVVASGTVSPAENPDLAFTIGGRVTDINAQVGDTVSAGTILASLDAANVLSANLAAAQANYAGLAAGPRSVDLAGKQTAVAQAQAALDNAYGSLAVSLSDALGKSEDAVHSVDTFYSGMNVADYPHLSFATNDSADAQKAGTERRSLDYSFDAWATEVSKLSASSSPDAIDAAASDSLARLTVINQYFSDLSAAANAATPPLSATETGALSIARSTASGLTISLTAEEQAITNDQLALQAAQDALALTEAGAPVEQVAAAKAQVDAAQAALAQGQIVAPFDGTIAAVQVKEGDVVTPNQPIISIVPEGKFEVDVYLSEIDVAKLAAGDAADVTLDAYGANTVFAATVGTIDKAPTIVNGVPSYKVTLIFATADPRIASGMHASATIHAGAKTDALIVPKGAVITENDQTFVLVESGKSTVKTPVTVGLVGSDTVEILSGLSPGESVAAVAGN